MIAAEATKAGPVPCKQMVRQDRASGGEIPYLSTHASVTDNRSRRRILLVEDDDHSRLALREILIQEGFDVATARDGSEGIGLAAAYQPDIIMLDLALPGINGFEAAQWLKSRPETAWIPLMAVTASWLGEDRARLGRIGFAGAVRKPFTPALLLAELRRLLPGAPPLAGQSLLHLEVRRPPERWSRGP